MRKNSRMRKSEKGLDKVIMYSGIGVLTLAIIVFALLMYSRSLNNEVQESKLSADKIASLVDGNNSNSHDIHQVHPPLGIEGLYAKIIQYKHV